MIKSIWAVCVLPTLVLLVVGCAPRVQLSARGYPKLANVYLTSTITPKQAQSLSRYDLIVLGLENQHNNPDALRLIRKLNPACRMLAHVPSDAYPEASHGQSTDPRDPWYALRQRFSDDDYLRAPDGSIVSIWPGQKSYNMTRPEIGDQLVQFVVHDFDWNCWDGVFWDTVWSEVTWFNGGRIDANHDSQPDDMSDFSSRWVYNLNRLLGLSRQALGPERLIVANETIANMGQWVINGRMFEGWPYTLHDHSPEGLELMLDQYLKFTRDTCPPAVTIVHTEANPDERDLILFGLTFTLLGDGYFAVNHGPSASEVPGDTGWHDCLWWYDEYYQDIGLPLTPARHEGLHVWSREFSQAVVFWNPNDRPMDVDLQLLDGASLSVTIMARTGLIYRKS